MEQPIPERQLGKQEQGGHSEILNLPEYGALYGRFLMASQAKTAGEIANIINPANTTVEFNLTEDALDKRNYNPVFENFSLAERQDQWKDFKPSTEYKTAYDQWRTEFTGFMVNIQDPKRALALKTILARDKESKDFTVDDADQLFNEFCQGKSDIDNFVGRVTASPTNLQELLPHLAWIASGLFGKDTASQAVARLIELESALRNNKGQVIEVINSSKDRINAPIDDEKKVLSLLYDSLGQKETVVPIVLEPDADEGDKDANHHHHRHSQHRQ